MPINFPSGPSDGDVYSYGGRSWVFSTGKGWATGPFPDNLLFRNITGTIEAGFSLAPFDAGTKSSGTFTPDAADHNYQFYINGGAHTIAAPTVDCAITLLVTNSGSAGVISFSGFTVGANTGSPFTTVDAHKFRVSIERINGVASYSVYALQ